MPKSQHASVLVFRCHQEKLHKKVAARFQTPSAFCATATGWLSLVTLGQLFSLLSGLLLPDLKRSRTFPKCCSLGLKQAGLNCSISSTCRILLEIVDHFLSSVIVMVISAVCELWSTFDFGKMDGCVYFNSGSDENKLAAIATLLAQKRKVAGPCFLGVGKRGGATSKV